MQNARGQQYPFSTHGRMFLWKCRRFWSRKCLDLWRTQTPNFRNMLNALAIWAIAAIQWLSHVFVCSIWWYRYFEVNIWNADCARTAAINFDSLTDVPVKVSNFFRQMFRPDGDSKLQPSDSWRMLQSFELSDVRQANENDTFKGILWFFVITIPVDVIVAPLVSAEANMTKCVPGVWKMLIVHDAKMCLSKDTGMPSLYHCFVVTTSLHVVIYRLEFIYMYH